MEKTTRTLVACHLMPCENDPTIIYQHDFKISQAERQKTNS